MLPAIFDLVAKIGLVICFYTFASLLWRLSPPIAGKDGTFNVQAARVVTILALVGSFIFAIIFYGYSRYGYDVWG